MRDKENLYLYGWWSAKKDYPILIFSSAGLVVPAQGSEAGRVIANAFVQSLASQMTEERQKDCQIHDAGPQDCPFYENAERSSEVIKGQQRFDADCRRHLKANLPITFRGIPRAAIMVAFDQLLAAF